jgi:tRNA pseudouridine38-40 synthase
VTPKEVAPGSRRFRAVIEYDGTRYYGFQRQRAGAPSIQAELERAIAQVTGSPSRVVGAGRTDTGVHALGQVVSFTNDWPDRHGVDALLRALNANLPADIAVTELAVATPQFHPRFDARQRTYEYRILNTPRRRPLWRERAWHVSQALDEARMNEAAAMVVGEHDFATFGRPPVGENTVRTVYRADWQREGEWLTFTVSATAFLQRMVRSLVGTMKVVGEGAWTPGDFREAFEARERRRSAAVAPPHGLYLVAVEYDE